MSEENKIEKKYPSLVVGVYIFNKKGEIFFFRSPHWSNQLTIPGGHVENMELVEDAAIREIKEETGLDIENLEFLKVVEIPNSSHYKKNKHIVSLNYKASLKDENQVVVLDKREGTEYFWLKPEEVVKKENLQESNLEVIKDFFINKKNKKSLFSKKECDKCEEYKQGWQRALADYKNLLQETEKKRSEMMGWSKQQILEDFIPVYNNFKIAFAMKREDGNEAWVQGIEHIKKQFEDVLKNHGLEEIKTIGEKFNEKLHDCISEEQSDKDSGVILKEVSGGYLMNGKVIIPAKVVVAK